MKISETISFQVYENIGGLIDTQEGNELYQLGTTLSQPVVEIKGDDGVKNIPPYIPISPTKITVTGIAPSSATGTYAWSVTPTGTTKIQLDGIPGGPITPASPAPLIRVIGIEPSSCTTDTVGVIFTYTPATGNAVSTTFIATVIGTSFTVNTLTTNAGPVRELFNDKSCSAFDIETYFRITSTATISTTPGSDTYAQEWWLGYHQQVISFTNVITYTHTVTTVTYSGFPRLDSITKTSPFYPHLGLTPFTSTGGSATAVFRDTPASEFIPWDDIRMGTQDNLEAVHYYVRFLLD